MKFRQNFLVGAGVLTAGAGVLTAGAGAGGEITGVCTALFRTLRSGFRFGQRYIFDRHGQLTLKQLRLSVLNEMHTNSYTGPRLFNISRYTMQNAYFCFLNIHF